MNVHVWRMGGSASFVRFPPAPPPPFLSFLEFCFLEFRFLE